MQDTDHLRNVAYKDASKLNARIEFWKHYGTPAYVWFGRFFDLLETPAGASVLELGCGPARLWQWGLDNGRVPDGWSVTLTDLSPGMLDEARQNLSVHDREFGFEIADVCELSYGDASFDIVIANYMLYHASDQRIAVAEISRVLKPEGRLYAATNSETHIAEILELLAQHPPVNAGNSDLGSPGPAHAAFTLENGGDMLAEKFSSVDIVRDDSTSLATDPQILVNYVLSMDAQVDEQRLVDTVKDHIARNGHFAVTRSSGLFIAKK